MVGGWRRPHPPPFRQGLSLYERLSGDPTPCKTTGVNLHSHVRYEENRVILHGVVSPEFGHSGLRMCI